MLQKGNIQHNRSIRCAGGFLTPAGDRRGKAPVDFSGGFNRVSAFPNTLSTESPAAMQNPGAAGILAERWPTLGRALSRYDQATAEYFSRMAYDAVEAGLIRHDDRQRLSAEAENLGIRSFDAQLLIACAVRQWALDRQYDPTPTPHAPALSFEYRAWRRVWTRIALVVGTAAALDCIILAKWLG